MLDRARRLLFGDDIFISYARADGSPYADELASRLVDRGFACRLDQWGTEPGDKIPDSILTAVRRSAMLVIVGTRGAGTSEGVEEEIRAFIPTGRNIIPIDIDGVIEEAIWWKLIKGLPVSKVAASESGKTPALTGVLNRIERMFNYTKKTARLWRITVWTLAVLITLIGASVAAAYLAFQFSADAKQSLREVETAHREVETARGEKDRLLENAKQVGKQLQNAQSALRLTQKQTREAERQARVAEQQERQAQEQKTEAERKERQAELMTQARVALSNGDPLLAMQSAKASLRISDTPEARLVLADAYNQGIPQELSYFRQIQGLAVSPVDSNRVAAIGTVAGRSGSESRLKIWDLRTGHSQEARSELFLGIEFGRDGQHLFAIAVTHYKVGPGIMMEREVEREVSLIQYDLELKVVAQRPLAPLLAPILPDSRPEEWDVRDIQDLQIDGDGKWLSAAGYAAPAWARDAPRPGRYPLQLWADLSDLSVRYHLYTEPGHEVPHVHGTEFTYRGRAVLLSDGEHLIGYGMEDRQVYAVNLKNGQQTEIGRHTSPVTDVAGSPSGHRVAAIGGDSQLSVFTLRDGVWSSKTYQLGGGGSDRVVFVDEDHVAVARADLSILLVSLKAASEREDTGPAQRIFVGHTARIEDLVMSSDGRFLASASDDKTVRLWSVREDHRRVLRGSRQGVSHIKFSRDSKRIYAGGLDGTIRIYEIEPRHRFVLAVDPVNPRQEARAPDADWEEGDHLSKMFIKIRLDFAQELRWHQGGVLTASTYDGRTTTWNEEYQLLDSWDKKKSDERRDAASDGPWAEVTSDRRLILHEVTQKPNQLSAKTGLFSPDHRKFVQFSYDDRSLYVWDVIHPDRSPVRLENAYGDFYRSSGETITAHQFARFSPGGRYLAFPIWFAGKDALCAIDLEMLRQRVFQGNLAPEAFDVSDAGDLAVAGLSGEVYVHSIPRDTTRTLAQHTASVASVAFSPDGRWLASGSRDRTVRLWDLESGEYIEQTLLNPVEQVVFSPDGRTLLAASGYGIHAWYVPTGSLDELLGPAGKSVGEPENLQQKASSEALAYPRQTENLAFMIHRPGTRLRRKVLEDSLGISLKPTPGRIYDLVRRLTSNAESDPAKFRAAVELSAYGKDVLRYTRSIAETLASSDRQIEDPRRLTLDLLQNPGWRVDDLTRATLDLLHNIGPESEGAVLETIKSSPNVRVRQTLVRALPGLYQPSVKARDMLLSLLQDREPDIRFAAALSLDQVSQDTAAISVLGEALYSGHDFRKEAATALGRHGIPAIPFLIEALNSPADPFYAKPRELASSTLVAMGPNAVPLVLSSLRSETGNRRSEIIRTLGDFGPLASSAVPDLVAVLREPNSNLRAEVSSALRNMGPQVIPYLTDVLPRAEGPARGQIIRVLGSFGPGAGTAVQPLIDVLSSSDGAEAAEALGNIGASAEAAVPALIRFVEQSHDLDRARGLQAMNKIKASPELVVAAILEVLEEETEIPSDPELWERDDLPGWQTDRASWSRYSRRPWFAGPIEIRGCEKTTALRAAIVVLGTFGGYGREATPLLTRIRQQYQDCREIVEAIDQTLELVK